MDILLYVISFAIVLAVSVAIVMILVRLKHQGPVMKCCTQCGMAFQTGVDGIGGSQMPALCDACAGIERDSKGYIWKPGESEQTLEDAWTGEVTVITKDEAFGRKS